MARRTRATHQFRVFLSHGYKAPSANLYFWSILSRVADFQFEVDPAKMPDGSRKPTSVTRLELLVRDCDAVVGIYSYPEESEATSLAEATAYFRLETDLAIRSRKPTLLFIDERYQHYFRVPDAFYVEWFNAQEVKSPAVSPSRHRFEKACREFCKEVATSKSYVLGRKQRVDRHRTAIIIGSGEVDSGYSAAVVEGLSDLIVKRGHAPPAVIRFPVQGAPFQTSEFDTFQWCLVDVGKGLFRTGLVGYLHGRFIPTLRALHTSGRSPDSIADYRSLYIGIEKGYDSDLIKWDAPQSLLQAVSHRLDVLEVRRELITNSAGAQKYFRKAMLRKDAVFLSYSGADRGIAVEIHRYLEQRFQTVFDYRQKESLAGGQDWPQQIEKAIENSKIGVQLISDSYFASAHCMRESSLMDLQRLDNRMLVIPIKVQDGDIAGRPLSQRLNQYLRLSDYETSEAMVEEIIRAVDKAA
jgi:hypothetical protein